MNNQTDVIWRWMLAAAVLCFVAAPVVQGQEEERVGFDITLLDEFVDGRPVAEININGQRVVAGMSTTSGVGLGISRRLCARPWIRVYSTEYPFDAAMVRLGQGGEGRLSEPGAVFVYDLPPDIETQAIIGWSMLASYIWEIDQPNQRQAFHDALPEEVGDGWQSFAIREFHGSLAFAVPTDGEELLVSLDTVSDGPVALSAARWEAWFEQAQPEWGTLMGVFSTDRTEGSGFSVDRLAVAPRLTLGELELGPVIVSQGTPRILSNGQTAEEEVSLTLDALANRRVIIDGPGGRVYFGPRVETEPEAGAYIDINRAQATFIPTNLEGGFPVAHVIEDGVAYRAGLRDGDTVVMVDGKMANNWPTDVMVRPSSVLNAAPGTRVRLIVQREVEHLSIVFDLGRCPLDPDEDGLAP